VELFPWVAGVDMGMGYSQSGVHHVWRRLFYGFKKDTYAFAMKVYHGLSGLIG
jgi:hypothetical protein